MKSEDLDRLEQDLLAAMMTASSGNAGAANVAHGVIKELRKREREDAAEKSRKRAAAKARREAPEALDERGRILWSLRRHQEIAATGTPVAAVQAQRAADACLARLAEMDRADVQGPEDMTPEEWRRHLEASFRELAPDDLEVAVALWLARRKLALVHDGGIPRIEPVQ